MGGHWTDISLVLLPFLPLFVLIVPFFVVLVLVPHATPTHIIILPILPFLPLLVLPPILVIPLPLTIPLSLLCLLITRHKVLVRPALRLSVPLRSDGFQALAGLEQAVPQEAFAVCEGRRVRRAGAGSCACVCPRVYCCPCPCP